jgi:hypothetical protein
MGTQAESFLCIPTQTWVNTPADGTLTPLHNSPSLAQALFCAVDFVTDPCGLEDDAESVVSSSVSSPSDITESPLPCTPPADPEDRRFQYDIQAEYSLRGEEAAIEGLLDLGNLGSNHGATVSRQLHAPQTGDCGSSSHPNQGFPSVQYEISKSSPLNGSNGTSLSFHSPASKSLPLLGARTYN